jgi:hypothetical protein
MGGSTPVQMHSLEDPAQGHVLTARKSNDSQATWRCKLLLLEAGECPKWKDIADLSLIYRSYSVVERRGECRVWAVVLMWYNK